MVAGQTTEKNKKTTTKKLHTAKTGAPKQNLTATKGHVARGSWPTTHLLRYHPQFPACLGKKKKTFANADVVSREKNIKKNA